MRRSQHWDSPLRETKAQRVWEQNGMQCVQGEGGMQHGEGWGG